MLIKNIYIVGSFCLFHAFAIEFKNTFYILSKGTASLNTNRYVKKSINIDFKMGIFKHSSQLIRARDAQLGLYAFLNSSLNSSRFHTTPGHSHRMQAYFKVWQSTYPTCSRVERKSTSSSSPS